MLGFTLMLLLGGPEVDVSWNAPEACPQAPAVQQAIADNLGRDTFSDALDQVTVQAEVVPEGQQWRLQVAVELPEGSVQRELVAPTCEELADAAGLIIAVALDPLRVRETRPLPTASALPQAWAEPPEPPPEPPSEPEPAPITPPPEVRPKGELRAAGMLDVGTLPKVRGGAQLGVGIVGRWFRADASLAYWAPRAIRPFETVPSSPGTRLQQAGAGLRGCLSPKLGAFEPSTCAGVDGGLAWARGVGIPSPQTTALPWLTTYGGMELAWVSRAGVGLFAGVDAQFHLVRPAVRLEGLGQALKVAPVGARASVGVLWRWGR